MIKYLIKSFYLLVFRQGFGSKKWKNRFEYFGNGADIAWPSLITGKGNISVGDRSIILSDSRIQVYNNLTGLNSKLKIGNHCYIGSHFCVLVGADIIIGNDVLIASYATIVSENHGINPESETPYMDQQLECKPVIIGDGSWIGDDVKILPGVTIGRKCILGAGCVVTHSIPDYSIVAGVPARIIKKYNFDSHQWESVK